MKKLVLGPTREALLEVVGAKSAAKTSDFFIAYSNPTDLWSDRNCLAAELLLADWELDSHARWPQMTSRLWGFVAVAGAVLCLPSGVRADDIICTVNTSTNTVTIIEVNEKPGAGVCKIAGVPLPKQSVLVSVLENPVDAATTKKPFSDKLNITPGGEITVLSDNGPEGKHQPNLKPFDIVRTEPPEANPGPVMWDIIGKDGGITHFVFCSDPSPSCQVSAPVPEPGTLVLFGTALLGLAATIRRRLLDGLS